MCKQNILCKCIDIILKCKLIIYDRLLHRAWFHSYVMCFVAARRGTRIPPWCGLAALVLPPPALRAAFFHIGQAGARKTAKRRPQTCQGGEDCEKVICLVNWHTYFKIIIRWHSMACLGVYLNFCLGYLSVQSIYKYLLNGMEGLCHGIN